MTNGRPQDERTPAGFVVALYLASALLLGYIVFQVVQDRLDRAALPADATTQVGGSPGAP